MTEGKTRAVFEYLAEIEEQLFFVREKVSELKKISDDSNILNKTTTVLMSEIDRLYETVADMTDDYSGMVKMIEEIKEYERIKAQKR